MRNVKKKVYYSHPMKFYDMPIERKALRIIKSKFKNSKIINPKNLPYVKMDDFCNFVKKCDILVAHPLSKNVLSAGVWKEIKKAFKCRIPVFCLDLERRTIFKMDSLKGFRCLSREETNRISWDYDSFKYL